MKQPAIYILTNKRNGTLYTGVTSNLPARIWQHREGVVSGFSKKYGCKFLVYYEIHNTMEDAILREKKIKAGSRNNKIQMIEALNPEWEDLFEHICR